MTSTKPLVFLLFIFIAAILIGLLQAEGGWDMVWETIKAFQR